MTTMSVPPSTMSLLEQEQAAAGTEVSRHDVLGAHFGREDSAVRDFLVHRIEGYARHSGHADPLRECIEGRTER